MKKKRKMFTVERGIKAYRLFKKSGQIRNTARSMGCSEKAVKNWIHKVKHTPSLKAEAESTIKGEIKPTKETKAQKIRDWLVEHPNGTHKECKKALKINVASSQFSDLTRKQRKDNNQPQKQPQLNKAVVTLERENAFLRWWNQGEREGFIDKLLEEISK